MAENNDRLFQITVVVTTADKRATILAIAATIILTTAVATAVVLAAGTITRAATTEATTLKATNRNNPSTNKTTPTEGTTTVEDQILDRITIEIDRIRGRIIAKGDRGPQGPTETVMYQIAKLLIFQEYYNFVKKTRIQKNKFLLSVFFFNFVSLGVPTLHSNVIM